MRLEKPRCASDSSSVYLLSQANTSYDAFSPIDRSSSVPKLIRVLDAIKGTVSAIGNWDGNNDKY